MGKGIFLFMLFCLPMHLAAQKLLREKTLGKTSYACNEPAIALNPLNPKMQIVATNKAHVFMSKNSGKTYRHQLAKSTLGVYGDPVLLYNKEGRCFYAHLSQDTTKDWPESFDQIVIQKSSDNGNTWNDGVGIGKNGKMHDKPWIGIDESMSSPYKGAVYISWTQFDKYRSERFEDSTRILFSVSHDHANTFSQPVVVSDRGGDCMDGDSTVEGATTCTGPGGEVYVAWAGHGLLFFDKSSDGGRTFGADKTIGEIPGGWDLEIPGFSRTSGLPFLCSDSTGKLIICTAFQQKGLNRIFYSESFDKGNNWQPLKSLLEEDSSHFFMPHAWLDKSTGHYYIIYYQKRGIYCDVMLSYRLSNEKDFRHIRVNSKSFKEPGKTRFMGDYINVCAAGNVVACCWTEPEGDRTVVKTRRVLLK